MINLSLDQPPEGEAGIVVTVKRTPHDDSEKVKREQEEHALFPDTGSYMIWGARPMLERMMSAHKKDLTKYNQKLGRLKISVRIRLTHTVTRRGNKYVYCGRYLYTKDNKYIGKMDNAVLRNEMKELWTANNMPPNNPLEGFSYKIFVANGQETDEIIVPTYLITDPRFGHLFQKFTRRRLGSM